MSIEAMKQALEALKNTATRSAAEQYAIEQHAIAALEAELAKPEPIYVMGNYAGEGKVVSASFGLPKGAFEFAPYTGAGEAAKIKHSLEPEQEQEPMRWFQQFGDAAPRKEWVGLTDEEFRFIASKYSLNTPSGLGYFQEEIEAKLRELNT